MEPGGFLVPWRCRLWTPRPSTASTTPSYPPTTLLDDPASSLAHLPAVQHRKPSVLHRPVEPTPSSFALVRTAPQRMGRDPSLETERIILETTSEDAAVGGPTSSACLPHRRVYLRSASRWTSTTGAPSCLPSTMSETPSAGHMVRVMDWLRRLLLSATFFST